MWGINDSIIVNHITPIINKVAQRNQLEVLDLHTLFEPADGDMQRDGIHPTDKGAAKMARIVADVLKQD